MIHVHKVSVCTCVNQAQPYLCVAACEEDDFPQVQCQGSRSQMSANKNKKNCKCKKMSLYNTLQPSLPCMLVSNGPPCIPCCTDSEIPGQ